MSIMRKVMWAFIACCILKANQAVAGDLYPEQAAAGLWHIVNPSSPPLNDQPDNTTTLIRSYRSTDDEEDIEWFQTHIATKYEFEKKEGKDEWLKQGQFSKALGTPEFKKAADRALAFFIRNPNWAETKIKFRKNGKCLELLYITAARYLLVTHILWKLQNERDEVNELIQCKENDKNITEIPPSVCYPEPYGSATCTSDYDVGLIGKDSGFLTVKFNDYFENTKGLDRPSEKVFDTNVYAFTLEYAMPTMFSGLPENFASSVADCEKTLNFQMQELVSAYYKVFKYNKGYFDQLCKTAEETLVKSTGLDYFKEWNVKFGELHKETPLTGEDVRLAHNRQYQRFVKKISATKGYASTGENLERLAKALLYAAEAYHTRGAIRHVVGKIQLNHEITLSKMDLWVSMIENWGESIKEYNHDCFDADNKPVILEICLLKMSKYLWRMFSAMCDLKKKYLKNVRGLVCFPEKDNPEIRMKYWLNEYKKKGSYQISGYQDYVTNFFKSFDCNNVMIGNPLPRECLDFINIKVVEYNKKMLSLPKKKKKKRPSDKR